jgi:hypothetical protein
LKFGPHKHRSMVTVVNPFARILALIAGTTSTAGEVMSCWSCKIPVGTNAFIADF